MNKRALSLAVGGTLLVSAVALLLNFLLTPHALWFFYPLYAAVWWPMSIAFCGRRKFTAFAAAGSLWTIAFLAVTNYVTPHGSWWFLYAVPPLLLWPVSMHFKAKMNTLGAAILVSAAIIVYYLAVNLIATPGYFWALYPIYVTLWWPMSLYFTGKGNYKGLSVAGALMTIVFFGAANRLNAEYPWALYACYPVLWWPIAMYFGRRLGGMKFSILCTTCTVLYYGALNLLVAPGSPWIIFIIFAALWWPLSVYYAKNGSARWYAAVMTAVSAAFFIAVNLIFSPRALWAIYPVYVMLWWPVTLFFAHHRKWFGYSVTASLMTIVFLGSVNYITSMAYPWSVYPALALLWWPLSVYFARHKSAFGYSVAGSLLAIGTLVTINLLTSAGFMWSVIPCACVLWWPASVLFAGKGKPFGYSVIGSILIIGLVAAINYMTSPGFPWFVFPTFAVLWWPLAVYFFHVRKRKVESEG